MNLKKAKALRRLIRARAEITSLTPHTTYDKNLHGSAVVNSLTPRAVYIRAKRKLS